MRPGLREVRWVLRLIPACFRLFTFSNTALLRYGLLVTSLGSGRVGVSIEGSPTRRREKRHAPRHYRPTGTNNRNNRRTHNPRRVLVPSCSSAKESGPSSYLIHRESERRSSRKLGFRHCR